LGRSTDDLAARDTRVLAIGKGTTRGATRVASMLKVPFPVLADPSGDAYARFGFAKSLLVIQQSGTVLIDRAGIVRYLHRATNPGDALDMYELTEAIKALRAA
jgi:peroxiredoxin